jgi:hypothetical protein
VYIVPSLTVALVRLQDHVIGHELPAIGLSQPLGLPYGLFNALRQPISQKSASSRVASLKITISSASRAAVR